LVADGLGQGALLRDQSVPQTPIGQEQANQYGRYSRHGDQVVAETHLFFYPLRLVGHGLGCQEEPAGQSATLQAEDRPDKHGEPSTGTLETVALIWVFRSLI